MIIATTTEQGTEEDTETTSRVTRSMFDNFMRRPSIEDQAIRTIASMANNDLSMMNPENDDAVLCDAAFVFLDRNKARFLISGKSAAWHFEDGKLKNRSSRDAAPQIGSGRYYEPHLEPVFELKQGKNAILAASQTLAEQVSDEEIEKALNESASPEEWMERLVNLVGEDKQFCAITAFLPSEKPSLLKSLFHRS